jgi:hypothetical protein
MLYNLWRNDQNLGAVNPQDVNLIDLHMVNPQDNFIILEDGQTPFDAVLVTEEPAKMLLPFPVEADFTDSLKATLAEQTLTTQDLLLEEMHKLREENLKLQTEVLDLRSQVSNLELSRV